MKHRGLEKLGRTGSLRVLRVWHRMRLLSGSSLIFPIILCQRPIVSSFRRSRVRQREQRLTPNSTPIRSGRAQALRFFERWKNWTACAVPLPRIA
jgi:hypothetical protein